MELFDGSAYLARFMRKRRRSLLWCAAALVVSTACPHTAASAPLHVRQSNPAAEAVIQGRHAEYFIRFDGEVDHAASRLEITRSGQLVQTLTPRMDSAVDVLFASGEVPAPGKYILHWQAVAVNGETFSGDIPFSVAP
jgi:methionine-rich copper-binding protein CopC